MIEALTTPVTLCLDAENISYRILWQNSATISIEDTAIERGISPKRMVKTMLLRDMGDQFVIACVPGNEKVDPKKVRSIFACRRMTCADANTIRQVTGYGLGAVSPIGLLQPLPVVFDIKLAEQHNVTISSGLPVAGIELASRDLTALCTPTFGDITRDG